MRFFSIEMAHFEKEGVNSSDHVDVLGGATRTTSRQETSQEVVRIKAGWI